MRTCSKPLLVALFATAAFSLMVSSASARRITVSEGRMLQIWRSLKFEGGLGQPLTCPVTLEASFHSRTLSKVSGQLIGYVTETVADSPHCTNGGATVKRETLPWHLQYNSFAGTLPSITQLKFQIVGSRFRVETGLVSCEATTTQTNPAFGTITVSAGAMTTIRSEGTIPCGVFTGTFEGTGEVFVQGPTGLSSTRINVRLVT
jgi:hypothetical protein